jgi:hypothetical protein
MEEPITKKDLQDMLNVQTKAIQKQIDDLSAKYDKEIQVINTSLAASKKAITLNQLQINDTKLKVENNTERIEALEFSNTDINELNKQVIELEEKLDDQINRNMRNNLIFKNIPELPNERSEQTKELVQTIMAEKLGIEAEESSRFIARVHRGGNRKETSRPIYIKFDSDRYAEDILRKAITFNKANRDKFVNVQQQFTKKIQDRRVVALQVRKILLSNKEYERAYIQYPATLKVKKYGEIKYFTHKEF